MEYRVLAPLFKPYPKMKDSGVSWLGKVPEHWEVKKLKWCVFLNPSKSEARALLDENARVTFLPMERVGTDGCVDAREIVTASEVWNGFTYFRREDVLVAKITPCFENGKGACLGTLPTEIGFGSTEFHVLRARRAISPQYLYRLTTVDKFRRLGAEAMTGAAGQQRVPPQFIANWVIALPPNDEQTAIIRFLDHMDRKIWRYIRAKQKQMKLLEEQKQIIIHHAVTRGLDPNVRLKPSGVEWLGDVPEHWEVLRLKEVITQIEQGWSPQCDAQPAEYDQWGVLKVGCVNRETFQAQQNKRLPPVLEPDPRLEIQDGDILMSRANTRELLGLAALAIAPRPRLILCDKLYRFRARSGRVDSNFLVYVVRQKTSRAQIESCANGASDSMQNIGQRVVQNLWIALPPMHEQFQIVSRLQKRMSLLCKGITLAKQEITLLREYRTRLISDVVTGKLDVREAAEHLPEEADDEPAAEILEDQDMNGCEQAADSDSGDE